MKVKLDENLPGELVTVLTSLGHDVHTVLDERLNGRDDATVFGAASTEGRLFITQDLDFADLRRFIPGTHPGIILLRLQDPNRRQIIEKIKHIATFERFEDFSRCFVVVTDRKLRVRRP